MVTIGQSDTLLRTVDSLQRIVSDNPSPEVLHQRAIEEGLEFDPEFLDEFHRRLRGEQRSVGQDFTVEEVSDAFMALLEGEEGEAMTRRVKRGKAWGLVRRQLQKSGARLARAMAELHELVRGTGIGYRPNLQELSEQITKWLKKAESGQETEQLASLAQRAAHDDELDPWKATLIRAWLSTERGKKGEKPTVEDLESLLLDAELATMLEYEQGPWEALTAQARAVRAHRRMGDALVALA